jgi:5,10-methylenetetrahydromethanopterin reductase
MEFGHVSWPLAFQGPALAKADEELGYDVHYFGENTCFHPDTFGEMRDAVRATSRIRIATGVTNTVTRHPSAIATALAPLQILSGGRVICGLGKGDSATAVIGRGPQKHTEFVEKAQMLSTYLQGGAQQMGEWESRLDWLGQFPDYAPVPLEIMCSGPKTLKAAAGVADRITLAIGAAPERLSWALRIIDEGLEAAGRRRADVKVGGFFQFAVSEDPARAAELLRVRVKSIVHMASFPGHDLSYQPQILRDATQTMRTAYDYRHHDLKQDNPMGALISPELALWFGISGSVAQVVDRLGAIGEMGLDYVMNADLPPDEWEAFTGRVMPQSR